MSYKPNSEAKSTVYKRTHIEQYTSQKVIYSEPGYSSDPQSKYYLILFIKTILSLNEIFNIILS